MHGPMNVKNKPEYCDYVYMYTFVLLSPFGTWLVNTCQLVMRTVCDRHILDLEGQTYRQIS